MEGARLSTCFSEINIDIADTVWPARHFCHTHRHEVLDMQVSKSGKHGHTRVSITIRISGQKKRVVLRDTHMLDMVREDHADFLTHRTVKEGAYFCEGAGGLWPDC